MRPLTVANVLPRGVRGVENACTFLEVTPMANSGKKEKEKEQQEAMEFN